MMKNELSSDCHPKTIDLKYSGSFSDEIKLSSNCQNSLLFSDEIIQTFRISLSEFQLRLRSISLHAIRVQFDLRSDHLCAM